jgi:hypothetical protein
LANVISPTIWVLDHKGKKEDEVPERLIVKTVTTSGDDFSSIWEKLFRELSLVNDRPTIGLRPNARARIPLLEAYGLNMPLSVDDVRRVLTNIPGSVFIIDEFDRASNEASKSTTDLINPENSRSHKHERPHLLQTCYQDSV